MAGGMAGYLTTASSLGGEKQKGKTPTGVGWYKLYEKFFCLSDGSARRSSGAAVAPGTRPSPPHACPPGHVSAGTPADSSLGATVGEVVRSGDGQCRPLPRRETF